MIDRYSRPQMKNIWSDKARFDAFLKVEIASLHAFSKRGIVPKEDYLKIKENAKFDVERIQSIEAEIHHDVMAFVSAVNENLGEEKKWVHYGLTSTDVVDTAQGLLLKSANEILEEDIDKLLKTLSSLALKYKDTPIMGRTHGMHAEITSFGLKWALFYDELLRDKKRFVEARKDVECAKLSGAVGNYIVTDIDIEKDVANELGLERAKISTQVLSRDRHAYYVSVLALIASLLEKMATEIRHLARQEIHEVEEGFSSKQKGSSAMPHKRNPISSENICGCARIMKSFVNAALDDNILWHERDISHSSAERIMFSDMTTLLDYMLNRFNNVLNNLVVYEEKMMENIYLTNGVIFSGRVLNYLVSKGYDRSERYEIIQKLSFVSLSEHKDFKKLLIENNVINEKEANELFDVKYYLKNVDEILINVGIEEK